MTRRTSDRQSLTFLQDFLAADGPRLMYKRPQRFLDPDRGEFSDVAGLDVEHPWERAAESLLVTILKSALSYLDWPLTDALPSSFEGIGVRSYMGWAGNGTDDEPYKIGSSNVLLGPAGYLALFGGTGWPTLIRDNPAQIWRFNDTTGTSTVSEITGIQSINNANDRIQFEISFGADFASPQHFLIQVFQSSNKRGAWMSNGRKIFLLQGARYYKEDTGTIPEIEIDTAKKGDRWRGTRISNNRYMFVSDRNAPRVAYLGEKTPLPFYAVTGATLDAAGTTLTKTGEFEEYSHSERDLCVITAGSGTVLGTYRVTANPDNDTVTLAEKAGTTSAGDVSAHFLRTTSPNLSLAGVVPPFRRGQPRLNVAVIMAFSGAGGGTLTAGTASVRFRLVDLDTNTTSNIYQVRSQNITSFELIMSDAQVASNELRLVIDTQTDAHKLFLHERGHLLQIWRKLSQGSTYHLEKEIPREFVDRHSTSTGSVSIDLTLSDEDLRQLPQMALGDVNKGLPPAGRDIAVLSDTGIVLIAGKTDSANFTDPLIQGARFKWPTVDNDNVVHVSRSDKFEPENFPPLVANQIVLSRIGDRFQRFATSGNDVLAVCELGVYRLTAGGIFGVQRRVIAETGLGTPWPESVITIDNKAYWVNENNVYRYDVEAIGTDRPPLERIADGISEWLREIFDAGETVQTHFDSRRSVLILRRIPLTETEFQDWELSLRTGASCFVEDRTGFNYLSSAFIEETEKNKPILYSVDDQGGAFEIGRKLPAGAQDDIIVGDPQGLVFQSFSLDDDYLRDDPGGLVKFDPVMRGRAIRFKSTITPAVDGAVRRCISLLHTAHEAEFNAVNSDQLRVTMLSATIGVMLARDVASEALTLRPFRLEGDGTITLGTASTIAGSDNTGIDVAVQDTQRIWVTRRDSINQLRLLSIEVTEDLMFNLLGDTEVVVSVSAADNASVVKVAKDKVAVTYTKDAGGAAIRIGIQTVNNLTFGPENVFESGTVTGTKVVRLADDRLLVAYGKSLANSVIPITVAGTVSIKGSPVTFNNKAVPIVQEDFDMQALSLKSNTGDPTGRALLVSRKNTKGGELDLIQVNLDTNVATVFAQTEFESANDVSDLSIALLREEGIDDQDSVCVIAFKDVDDSDKGKVIGIRLKSGFAVTTTDFPKEFLSSAASFNHLARIGNNHFIVFYSDGGDSGKATYKTVMQWSSIGLFLEVSNTSVNFLLQPDLPGITRGVEPGGPADEYIIGGVPLRIVTAPILGDRPRNRKLVSGVSIDAIPAGRNITLPSTVVLKVEAFRNYDTTAEKLDVNGSLSATIPIQAPSEVVGVDKDNYAPMEVEGKAIELKVTNEDRAADLKFVDFAANVKEFGEFEEDRSTTE